MLKKGLQLEAWNDDPNYMMHEHRSSCWSIIFVGITDIICYIVTK